MATWSLAVVGVLALASGCGSPSGSQTGALNQPGPPPGQSQPVKTPQITDPIAPPFTPVARNGAVPDPSVRAHSAPFTKTVTYPDHIALKILSIHQSTTTGHGPGEIPGRPVTTMRIRFANNSSKPENLNEVVVTVVYGTPGRLASPVYEGAAADFQSTVSPGGSAVATYSFSIPTSELGNVTMKVDFDGLHAAATFVGRVA